MSCSSREPPSNTKQTADPLSLWDQTGGEGCLTARGRSRTATTDKLTGKTQAAMWIDKENLFLQRIKCLHISLVPRVELIVWNFVKIIYLSYFFYYLPIYNRQGLPHPLQTAHHTHHPGGGLAGESGLLLSHTAAAATSNAESATNIKSPHRIRISVEGKEICNQL